MTVAELVTAVSRSGQRYVVITGGEPLLQREFPSLCRELIARGYHVTVETAGTVAPEFVCSLLSLSPKTANSDPPGPWGPRHRQLRQDRSSLRALLDRHPEYQLKFVVQGEDDLPEILHLVGALGANRDRVLLMPEGKTALEVARVAPTVAALCLKHGFRYSPRLHLELFGSGRGV